MNSSVQVTSSKNAIYKPWLIQRGEINKPYNQYKDQRLSVAVDLSYMGSAEFEFGALPKSLREFQLMKESLHLDKFEFKACEVVVKGEKYDLSQTIRILHGFDTEKLNVYIDNAIIPIFYNKVQLKERSEFGFSSIRFDGERSKIDFWWDIENHVIWSADKMFMKRIMDHLKASWDYMDTNAK